MDQHKGWKYMAKTVKKNGYVKMIERICSQEELKKMEGQKPDFFLI